MLCFFKYFMFAADNLNRLLLLFGKQEMKILLVLLPAGISFYTFESISYNVDIYFGRAKPASAWVRQRFESERPRGAWLLDAAQAGAAGPERVRLLHHPVSASRRRADHPLPGPGAAIARAYSHGAEVWSRNLLLRSGIGQEDLDRQPRRASWPTRPLPLGRCTGSTPGTACSATRFRFTSTSPVIPTWRSGLASCSASSSRRTSTHRTSRRASRNSGGAGTSRCRPGCAITFTSPGRQPQGRGPDVSQSHRRDVARRFLARGLLEFSGVGRDLRRVAGAGTSPGKIEHLLAGSCVHRAWR